MLKISFDLVLFFLCVESRVPVINLEDGSRLSGDEAPLKRDLDKWLNEHPGYMVDGPPEMYGVEDEDLDLPRCMVLRMKIFLR